MHQRPSRRVSCGHGACVEAEIRANGVRVRDTKDPGGPDLFFTDLEWTSFLEGVRQGRFDLHRG
jgi:hypothetical protein